MVPEEIIRKAVEMLRQAASPRKIILFGSYAEGRADDRSDVDFMVVEEGDPDVPAEIVRLLRALSPLRIPADVIVVGTEAYEQWRRTPGTVVFEADTAGKVLYEAA